MARQLTLIDPDGTFRLDEQTKELGRQGLAEARAALAEAVRRDATRRAQSRHEAA